MGILIGISFVNHDIEISIDDTNTEFIQPYPMISNDNVLNSDIQSQIQWNNESLTYLSDEILDSFNTGEWKDHSYTPTIRATYHGIRSLEIINTLDEINENSVITYLMSLYNDSTHLFKDEMCGLLPYSVELEKKGYSQVEATAYAILILDILNSLDELESAEQINIINTLRGAINTVDGGFCHSPTGIPGTKYENSSLQLSYYGYLALQVLQPSYPLSPEQTNSLIDFVSDRQHMDTSHLEHYGGYMDTSYSTITTIESTYYAVSLLEELGGLITVNSPALIHHLETLNDTTTGGVYNVFHPSKTLLPNPEYFSSSLTLAILNITGVPAEIDTDKCVEYIQDGYDNVTNAWELYSSSDVFYLKDQMLILIGLDIINEIQSPMISIHEYISNHHVITNSDEEYGIGISPLISSLGNILGLRNRLAILDSVNRISELHLSHANAILSYIATLLDGNLFSEIPGFDPTDLNYRGFYGHPLEFSVLPYNISENQVFGRGIHQTASVLDICSMMGKLTELNGIINLNILAQQILDCQVDEGYFVPYTGTLLGSYESMLLVYDATRSLNLIDTFLESSYLSSLNETALRDWLLLQAVFDGELLHFEDSNPDTFHTAKITWYVTEIDRIMDLGILGPVNRLKLQNWVMNHLDLPTFGTAFNVETAYWIIQIYKELFPTEALQLELPPFVNSIEGILGSNRTNHPNMFLSNSQYEFLHLCTSDWYSATLFSTTPQIQVGYNIRFDVVIVSITDWNFENHEITLTLLNAMSDTGVSTSLGHVLQFIYECPLEWYPSFTVEIIDDFQDSRTRSYNFTINSHLLYVMDVSHIPSHSSFTPGEPLTLYITTYLNPITGISYKPINCSISSTILNETTEILTINESIQEGKFTLRITVDTEVLEPREYIIDITLSHPIFQYEPSYIGDSSNLTRNESSIHIASMFTIEGKDIRKWNLFALLGIFGIAGVTFCIAKYHPHQKLKKRKTFSE